MCMEKEYQLSEKTKKSIEKSVGLTIEEIQTMSVDELTKSIEAKIGKKLSFATEFKGFFTRDVYLYLNRFITREEINKGLSKIKLWHIVKVFFIQVFSVSLASIDILYNLGLAFSY